VVAGLTDVDAVTLSMAESSRDGFDRGVAATAIVLAALSNTAVKCAMATGTGTPGLRLPTAVGTASIVIAGGLGLLLA
jgi:uncharacterized membrane protein (DUF4010 family)